LQGNFVNVMREKTLALNVLSRITFSITLPLPPPPLLGRAEIITAMHAHGLNLLRAHT